MNSSSGVTEERFNPPESPLLNQPPEMRNSNYEHILTAPHGLLYQPPARSQGNVRGKLLAMDEEGLVNDDVEFNQLKYVNKQLYDETADLELKYNAITFLSHGQHAYNHLLRFAQDVGPSKLLWLKTVILKPLASRSTLCSHATYLSRYADSIEVYADKLSSFCMANPHIIIKYVIEEWRPLGNPSLQLDPHKLIGYGVFLAIALHGENSTLLLPHSEYTSYLNWNAKIWHHKHDVQALRAKAPTLKIFFNMTRLDEEQTQAINASLTKWGYSEEFLSKWFKYVEDWIENGI